MTSKKTTLFFKTGMLAAMLMAWPAASAPTIGDAPYGQAHTTDRSTRLPRDVQPLMDYWMRDTWMTLGPDGYYYMTGTTADPARMFPGQTHCWDWNDGIYLFRSKDMKEWTPMGRVWSLDDNGTWQREAKVFGEDERYPKRSLNGDVMDNRFRAVWAPELHYLKSQGFRHIEKKALNGRIYYLHAEPYEYCVGNVYAIEKEDDVVVYDKIDDTLRIDVFDASVFAVTRMLIHSGRAADAERWFNSDKKEA